MIMRGTRAIRHRLAVICAAIALAPLVIGSAFAQSGYPNHPIKLVVPYPPGALTDLLARSIGDPLAVGLKQPVVVDNKPGAGSLVALRDLLAGAIQVGFGDVTIDVANIQGGKVTALGTSAAKPARLLPGLAPIAGSVAGFDWEAWQGIVALAGTAKEIVAGLS